METEENKQENKRLVCKMRTGFLSKAPKRIKTVPVLKLTKYFDIENFRPFHPAYPLVEQNGKLLFEGRFSNSFFYLSSFTVETQGDGKLLKGWLEPNPTQPSIPWQYNVERLRSYGDQNLADWAGIIENMYSKAPKLCSIKELLAQKDPEVVEFFKAMEERIKHLETYMKEYPCFEVSILVNEDGMEFSSNCFNEKMIELLDHNIEEFPSLCLTNGIPQIFEMENFEYINRIKSFFQIIDLKEILKEDDDFDIFIICNKGIKKEVRLRLLLTIEIIEDKVYLKYHFIVIGQPKQVLPVLDEELIFPVQNDCKAKLQDHNDDTLMKFYAHHFKY